MSELETGSTATARTEGAPSTFLVELIVALGLVALGLLVAWDSYRTGSDWSALSGPRAGYFPFRLGLLLAMCGAVVAIQAVRKRGLLRLRFIEPGQIRPVLIMAIPSVIFVAGVQWLGIYVASFVFVAAFMRWVDRLAWWRCLLVSVCLVTLLFWLFEKRFYLPLPKGPLEAWLGIY